MLPIVSETAITQLSKSANEIRYELIERKGIKYEVEDIQTVLILWLQSSIESLCEDAAELCVSGDKNHASFNREAFNSYLSKMVPTACIIS
jgi:hypothetical protein